MPLERTVKMTVENDSEDAVRKDSENADGNDGEMPLEKTLERTVKYR